MIKIIYWNIKRKADTLLDEIVKLSQDTDILILAELTESEKKLNLRGTDIKRLVANISNKTGFNFINNNIDSWIHVWARKGIDIDLVEKYDKLRKPKDIVDKESADSEYFAYYLNKYERMQFYKVCFSNVEFLLVPIHFPSRMYASVSKQKDISVHFRRFIEKIEERVGLKSIVVGDFNMNPFELGMIHHEGFHAIPSQQINTEIEFYGTPYQTFYNPTWEKYGDFEIIDGLVKNKPSGSYYLSSSSDINYYWFLFDQIIMRKELIKYFSFKDFKILTSIHHENDLLNKDFTPNDNKYSDHLPITFILKI